MQWTYYFCNIVQSYKVVVIWWPTEHITFANLSTISSSLQDLEMLLWKWEMASLYWKQITDDHLEEFHCEHNLQIKHGDIWSRANACALTKAQSALATRGILRHSIGERSAKVLRLSQMEMKKNIVIPNIVLSLV